jgi:CRISPR-associated protein Cas1
MQQAMVEALKQSQKPIPPPLFVVLGYQVRQEKTVQIQSNETIWRQGMSTLYLVQQGATVSKEQGRFLVKTPKEAPLEIPAREIERVLVFGNIQLTTAIISDCLAQQIPVVFLSQLGDYKGHLWSAENDDIRIEKVQYQRQDDADFRLTTARAIVQGKLRNSKQLLLRLNRKRQLDSVKAAIAGLDRDLEALTQAETLDQLRGYEGSAATRYFRALGDLITNPAFSFTERNRRPPKDPINSLLSFGYTLLYNNVLSLLLAEGLNPYLGNLHGSEKKQTFLAFDLTEEFRSPVVDSVVMRLINRRIFSPTDFTWPTQTGGVYLNDTARRIFIQKMETRLSEEVSHPDVQGSVSYRRAIQLQVKRYKQSLVDNVPYAAFLRAT